jgi:hypothetical protein
VLTVSEALGKMRTHQEGALNFCEISKLLMIVIMGTFIFEPTHARLKTKLINFGQLLSLFTRKNFTGYMELAINKTLNYLTFFNGEPREGYFVKNDEGFAEFPAKQIAALIEHSEENGEINVYESVGEENLHEPVTDEKRVTPASLEEPADGLEDQRAQFNADILDLCLAAIYEDLFRIMLATCLKHLPPMAVDGMVSAALEQAVTKYPQLLGGVRERNEGKPATSVINFERLLKAKKALTSAVREKEFMSSLNDFAFIWLLAMRRTLPKPVFEQGLKNLGDKIASSRKAYQGNFMIVKFLYEFSRLLEKVYSE